MYSSTGDKGIQELDQLISNTEFENAVQDKTIATEKEKIEIFEKKLKEKTQDIERMEKEILNNNKLESNSNVKIHLCRESLTSLKKTYCVLDDHIEALNKQLQHTKATRQDQQLQQVGVIDKYSPIWNNYERKYQCNEKVRQLMAFQDELKIIEKENDSLKDNIEQMMSDIHEYHLANKNPLDKLTHWIIQIASHKVGAQHIASDVHDLDSKNGSLLVEIDKIKSELANMEAKLSEELNKKKSADSFNHQSNGCLTTESGPRLLTFKRPKTFITIPQLNKMQPSMVKGSQTQSPTIARPPTITIPERNTAISSTPTPKGPTTLSVSNTPSLRPTIQLTSPLMKPTLPTNTLPEKPSTTTSITTHHTTTIPQSSISQFTISGVPQSTLSGVPQSTLSGVPQSTLSGVPQSTLSGVPQSTLSGVLQSTLSGVPQSTLSGVPQSTLSGVLQSTLSGVPQSTLSGVPQSSLSGVPQSTLSGVPQSTLSGVPQSLSGIQQSSTAQTVPPLNPSEVTRDDNQWTFNPSTSIEDTPPPINDGGNISTFFTDEQTTLNNHLFSMSKPVDNQSFDFMSSFTGGQLSGDFSGLFGTSSNQNNNDGGLFSLFGASNPSSDNQVKGFEFSFGNNSTNNTMSFF